MRKSIVAATALSMLSGTASASSNVPVAAPATDRATWITSDDYPSLALRAGQSGTVAFTLDVDTAGMPKRCTITASSGSVALDSGTCATIMRRARFVPAKNRRGKPVESKYSSRVAWRMPSSPTAIGPLYAVTFDTAAVPIVCRVSIEGKVRLLRPADCHSLISGILDNGGSLDHPVGVPIGEHGLGLVPE